MKKLYTLALAAAVAVSASAAPHFSLNRVSSFNSVSFEQGNAKADMIVKANENNTRQKAATNAPSSLDGKQFLFAFGLQNGNNYSVNSSFVDFSFLSTDNESGLDVYQMDGLLDGIFNNITVHPLQVGYDKASGLLVLPSGQDFVDFNTNVCSIWNKLGEYVYPDVPFYFDWNGSGFTWDPVVKFNDGTSENSAGIFVGLQQEDGKISGLFSIDDFKILAINGKMASTSINPETEEEENYNDPVAVTIDGNDVVIYQFYGMFDVPCTLDKDAKTLTATKVQCGNVNLSSGIAPVYLSEADNDYASGYAYNANPTGTYELVMTFTVADGKTQITVPDWNAFVMDGNEDYECLPLTKNSSISLDFDITAETQGVSDIIADDANAPVEYFNLQGVRVANPENGLYIRRQGNKAQKVLVK